MDFMNYGWNKFHRKIREHWIWEDPVKLKWWMDLIMSANFDTNTILVGNEVIKLEIGDLHYSQDKLAKRWRCSRTKVKNFLLLLEKENMIKFVSDKQKGTTIKIVNYNLYQTIGENKKQQKNIQHPSENHQKVDKETNEKRPASDGNTSNNHNKESKEGKEGKESIKTTTSPQEENDEKKVVVV